MPCCWFLFTLFASMFPIRSLSVLVRHVSSLHQRRANEVFRFSLSQKSQLSLWASWRGGAIDPEAFKDITEDRPSPAPLLGRFPVSVSGIRGARSYMEDDFCVSDDLVGVFDGHGGPDVSNYLRFNLHAELQAAIPKVIERGNLPNEKVAEGEQILDPERPTSEDLSQALRLALNEIDKKIGKIRHWSFQGSTAVSVLLHEVEDPPLPPVTTCDSDGYETKQDASSTVSIIAANVGDSRVIISRNRTAVPLSRDHKPNDPLELERIKSLGGKVNWHGSVDSNGQPILKTGVYRVNGSLALSRAIGDHSERPFVSSEPEVLITALESGDEFIVLASDGLWDALESESVVSLIHALLRQPDVDDRDAIAHLLVEEAVRRGSLDNITVMIIWLREHKPVMNDDSDLGMMDF